MLKMTTRATIPALRFRRRFCGIAEHARAASAAGQSILKG